MSKLQALKVKIREWDDMAEEYGLGTDYTRNIAHPSGVVFNVHMERMCGKTIFVHLNPGSKSIRSSGYRIMPYMIAPESQADLAAFMFAHKLL